MTTPQNPDRALRSPFWGWPVRSGYRRIYYNQPLLLEMGRTYGATAGHTGFVAVATQIGYAVGLLGFVPLGDVLERRGLMMRMYGAVAVALLLVAAAPSMNLLIAGSVLIGMFASVTHVALLLPLTWSRMSNAGARSARYDRAAARHSFWPEHFPDGSAASTAGAGFL